MNCTFIIHKNGNETSIQPTLKSNSTTFMFNNIFCEIGKNVIHWRGAWGNGKTVQIASWKCNFGIYLDIQAITTFIPSIGSWCVIIHLSIIHVIYNALLKSEVSSHSKAYSSHSCQPTGIGLGSLWRGKRCILQIISVYL